MLRLSHSFCNLFLGIIELHPWVFYSRGLFQSHWGFRVVDFSSRASSSRWLSLVSSDEYRHPFQTGYYSEARILFFAGDQPVFSPGSMKPLPWSGLRPCSLMTVTVLLRALSSKSLRGWCSLRSGRAGTVSMLVLFSTTSGFQVTDVVSNRHRYFATGSWMPFPHCVFLWCAHDGNLCSAWALLGRFWWWRQKGCMRLFFFVCYSKDLSSCWSWSGCSFQDLFGQVKVIDCSLLSESYKMTGLPTEPGFALPGIFYGWCCWRPYSSKWRSTLAHQLVA